MDPDKKRALHDSVRMITDFEDLKVIEIAVKTLLATAMKDLAPNTIEEFGDRIIRDSWSLAIKCQISEDTEIKNTRITYH